MTIESTRIHITPSLLLCEACHLCNLANCLQRKSLWIHGIIGMQFNILWGGPCALPLFFDSWYLHAHILDTSLYQICIFVYDKITWTRVVWYVLNAQFFYHFLCLYIFYNVDTWICIFVYNKIMGHVWYGMYSTPNVFIFYSPLHNCWESHYHSEVPYLWIICS